MRERLLAAVWARIEQFTTANVSAVVLDPAALAEVAALLQTAPDPAADLEVAQAAGLLYWCRHLVLGPGDNQQELSTALRLLELVYRAQPTAVPAQVRARLDANLSAAYRDRGAVEIGHDLLQHALDTGDPAELDGVIDVARQALNADPSDHPDRAVMLSNLGLALLVRFERTGDKADLDEAVRAGMDAAAAIPADNPDRARTQSMVGVALQMRFERTIRRVDPGEVERMSSPSEAVRPLCERAGRPADPPQAAEAGRATVAASSADYLEEPAVAKRERLLAEVHARLTSFQSEYDRDSVQSEEALAPGFRS
jgi:hypothetical protein